MSRVSAVQRVHPKIPDRNTYDSLLELARQIDELYKFKFTNNRGIISISNQDANFRIDTVNNKIEIRPGIWIAIGLDTVKLQNPVSTASNALQDITGLAFTIQPNRDYLFEYRFIFRTALTTTGILLSINGPATPNAISYDTDIMDGALGVFKKEASRAYNAGTPTTGVDVLNVDCPATLSGIIRNGSTLGILIPRVASEVLGSIVSVMQGSVGWIKEI